jgi:hypothetical protein
METVRGDDTIEEPTEARPMRIDDGDVPEHPQGNRAPR